jgi:hypothetical protein
MQRDRVMEEGARLRALKVGQAFEKAGFELEHTGGGIWIWTRYFDKRRWAALVGDAVDPSYPPEKLRGQKLYMGLYGENDYYGIDDEATVGLEFDSAEELLAALAGEPKSEPAAARAWRRAVGRGHVDGRRRAAEIAVKAKWGITSAVAATSAEIVEVHEGYPGTPAVMVYGEIDALSPKEWLRLGPNRWIRLFRPDPEPVEPRANPRRRARKKAPRSGRCRR